MTTGRAHTSLVAVVAVLAAGCSASGSATVAAPTTTAPPVEVAAEEATTDEVAWPAPDWEVTAPVDAGLDAAALAAMAHDAADSDTSCLVVTKDGRLVEEWYADGWEPTTEREAFSVTKSVTAALVGIAADRGLLELDQPVADFVEEWRGTPSEAVTVRNLLSNDSGRFHDVETDYGEMAGRAHDKTAFAIGLSQQHEPGTTWVYNNSAIQVLEQVLEEATGMATTDWARTALFEPLGMSSHLRTDGAGNALVFMGLQASCRDLARFGLLWLRGGQWQGEQVVSSEWVELSVTPSQELNPGYGLLWWLDEADGRHHAAIGLHDQYVVVFPEKGVVVARLGQPGFGLGDIVEHVEAAS